MKIEKIYNGKIDEFPELDEALIIKVGECNLRCSTCKDDQNNIPYNKYSLNTLLEQIEYNKADNVLITGGEPLMFFEVGVLCNALYSIDKNVFLKTNGSGPIETIPEHVTKIVNFKLTESGEKSSFFFENLYHLSHKDFLKFDIFTEQCLEEAITLSENLDYSVVPFGLIFHIRNQAIEKEHVHEQILQRILNSVQNKVDIRIV